MKIISSSAQLITETNPIKKIELIGRTCYKSEDRITEDSAAKFVDGLISRSHFAMLEHANMTFEITGVESMPADVLTLPYVRYSCKYPAEQQSPVHYLTLSLSHLVRLGNGEGPAVSIGDAILRMAFICFMTRWTSAESEEAFERGTYQIDYLGGIVKARILDDIQKEIIDFNEDDWNIHGSYTFKFICDRGVSHELVRHRCAVAQESTRYCNYSKDKFGGEITYIQPASMNEWPRDAVQEWTKSLSAASDAYMHLLNIGMTPQQARAVLPNSLKTEVILTMPVWQWKHFFNLRSIGTTGKPHPDMKVVADMAHNIFKEEESKISFTK